MSNPILTEDDKSIVVQWHCEGISQSEIAMCFGVSRRTVQRTLIKAGMLKTNEKKPRTVSDEEETILALVKSYNLNPNTLQQVFNSPTLNKINVQRYLVHMPADELASLTYAVGITRIAERAKVDQEAIRQNKEAANG